VSIRGENHFGLMFPRPPRFLPPLGPPRASARQRALAELHGLDLEPLERSRERPAKSVAALMPGILTRLRMDKRQGEAEIARVWRHLIDPAITAHAQPVGLNKGTLFVHVDSNVWLDEIVRYRRKEILDRLQHSFGRQLIQRISFRVG
jgi:predicted nucleic acid-binding Zn ribbon protein